MVCIGGVSSKGEQIGLAIPGSNHVGNSWLIRIMKALFIDPIVSVFESDPAEALDPEFNITPPDSVDDLFGSPDPRELDPIKAIFATFPVSVGLPHSLLHSIMSTS
mmetsp:Transcript_7212/g.13156  ORF Transcript_7212/g.13156 Transcript_7212/m.13156 type:complete len:106 (-) Transcript_7212:340-657(-)